MGAAAVLIAITLGGAGAYAGVSSSSSTLSPSGSQITQAAPGPGRLSRVYGFDPTTATTVATLKNGDSIRILADNDARCLLRSRDSQIVGEVCAPNAGISSGQGITVSDECGADSSHLMEITGLAPEAVTAVRLVDSDGTSQIAAVESGTFKFEGTNPADGAAYPAMIEWLSGDTRIGTANLPVAGGEFCLPAE